MNSLGIYFGSKVISVVETKGKKVLNNLQISRLRLTTSELEEKVPDEIKVVALFKDELRRNNIEAKEATIAFSGKDLIIRTFEMPVMPPNELQGAVNFEAKKYIPFKVEDLVSDFQIKFDKANRRNLVLFMGIKKETLDKYLSILSQLNIKANALEYSAFSALRFLKLAGLNDKGIIGVISIDFQEEAEINFTVLEDGFPLFSRDITLTTGPEGFAETEAIEPATALEKLKTEVRVSLDYYRRKLSNKEVKKIIFLANQDYRADLETFIKDIGLSAQFIDATKYASKPMPFSLTFIKGYGSSLFKVIGTALKLNLLAAKAKIKPSRELGATQEAAELLTQLKAGLKVDPKVAVLSLLICILTFVFSFYQRLSSQKVIQSIATKRIQVSKVNPNASYEQLTAISAEYRQKMNTFNNLIGKQVFFTDCLNAVAGVIPEGIWLTNLYFKEEPAELILQCIAYKADSNKELQVVNSFLANLKKDAQFSKYFKNMSISTLDRSKIGKTDVTNFTISCRN